MGEVINLAERRKKKEEEKEQAARRRIIDHIIDKANCYWGDEEE